MEAALKTPPLLLERTVAFLIPPAARESVAGDLWERYRSPAQYMGEALGALPFVIASQARRNANLPVIGLQGFLLFCCFNEWTRQAVLFAIGFFFFLLVTSAYQSLSAPSASRAGMDPVLVAFGLMVVSLVQRDAEGALRL
jgi:hypothetical protein